MGIIKDYKLNVGVFVMYHSLEAIHSNYYGTLPKDVERQTNKLLNVLIDSLPSDPVYRDYDYEDVEYYMRAIYEDHPSPFADAKKI